MGMHTTTETCLHEATRAVDMPPGSRHYKRLECANCGLFLRFIAKPETIERVRLNGYKLAQLTMCDRLNQFERSFIDSLAKAGQTRLSPKQQAVFDRICMSYLAQKRSEIQNEHTKRNAVLGQEHGAQESE
jgi:hypothetical protein